MVRWCWVNFQCRGVLLIWMIVGQAPTVLAVGTGGVVLTFFSPLSFLSSFSLSLGDDPIYTEILSQRAVKHKTNNQPTIDLEFLNAATAEHWHPHSVLLFIFFYSSYCYFTFPDFYFIVTCIMCVIQTHFLVFHAFIIFKT